MDNSASQPLPDSVIPFYGGEAPHLFEIERRCMDRDGKVLDFLHQHLPPGPVLDIGAGNGFTAARLTTATRTIIPLEPDPKMADPAKPLRWVQGVAQYLPFATHTFEAVYATWAFFFDGVPGLAHGLQEARRVIKPHGLLVLVDNAGDDEFCALSPRNIASNRAWWTAQGFEETIVRTSYRFDSLAEAQQLLSFYFGAAVGQKNTQLEIGYNVVIYTLRL